MRKWKWNLKWQARSLCLRLLWWMQDFLENPVDGLLVLLLYLIVAIVSLFACYQAIMY
jgi:hypothetical protein